jgi:uncharacterized protein
MSAKILFEAAMEKHGVRIPRDELATICQRHGIQRLSLFGSILRDDFRPESDIDMLVEFKPDARVGLRLFTIEKELSDLLGRKVDLNTRGFLSPDFREDVVRQAEVQYDAAG